MKRNIAAKVNVTKTKLLIEFIELFMNTCAFQNSKRKERIKKSEEKDFN